MEMPGRKYSAGNLYRYGFNGKEKDSEVKGEGNQYDYGFRIYDPRMGRFLSVDPLAQNYPWYTPYQFAGNTPIWAKDLDGLEPTYPNTVENYMERTDAQIKKIDAYYNYNTSQNTFHMWNTHKFLSFFDENTKAKQGKTPTGNQFSNQYCKFDCITSVVTGLRILFGDYSLKMAEGGTYKKQSEYMESKGYVSQKFTFNLNTKTNSNGDKVPVSLDKDLGQELINSTNNEEGIHTFMGEVGNGWHTYLINVDVTKTKNGFDYAFYRTEDENANAANNKRMTKDEFNKTMGEMLLWFGTPGGSEGNLDAYRVRHNDNGEAVSNTGSVQKLKHK